MLDDFYYIALAKSNAKNANFQDISQNVKFCLKKLSKILNDK